MSLHRRSSSIHLPRTSIYLRRYILFRGIAMLVFACSNIARTRTAVLCRLSRYTVRWARRFSARRLWAGSVPWMADRSFRNWLSLILLHAAPPYIPTFRWRHSSRQRLLAEFYVMDGTTLFAPAECRWLRYLNDSLGPLFHTAINIIYCRFLIQARFGILFMEFQHSICSRERINISESLETAFINLSLCLRRIHSIF